MIRIQCSSAQLLWTTRHAGMYSDDLDNQSYIISQTRTSPAQTGSSLTFRGVARRSRSVLAMCAVGQVCWVNPALAGKHIIIVPPYPKWSRPASNAPLHSSWTTRHAGVYSDELICIYIYMYAYIYIYICIYVHIYIGLTRNTSLHSSFGLCATRECIPTTCPRARTWPASRVNPTSICVCLCVCLLCVCGDLIYSSQLLWTTRHAGIGLTHAARCSCVRVWVACVRVCVRACVCGCLCLAVSVCRVCCVCVVI